MRNLQSGYWRGWLKPEFRCVVSATSFCEYDERHAKRPTWFALGEDRPLFAFAGIWPPLDRHAGHQGRARRGRALALRLPDQDANAEVAPVHPKAMPVLLRTADEIGRWLTAPTEDALELQRLLLDGALEIVAIGQRQDGPASAPLA